MPELLDLYTADFPNDSNRYRFRDGVIEPLVDTSITTLEGNPIHFETLNAQHARNTIIDIEPIQDLHGYNKPWLGGAGKNKLNQIRIFPDGEQNGTNLWKYILTIPNGTYTASTNIPIDGATCSCFVTESGAAASATNGIALNQPRTYTISSEQLIIYVRIHEAAEGKGYIITEQNLSDGTYWIQIESGSQNTSYEPYENICPINGLSQVKIVGCGKNLFDKTTLSTTENKYLNINNELATPGNTRVWRVSDYIPVIPGAQYKLSNYQVSSTTSPAYCFYDINKNFVYRAGQEYKSNTSPITITIPSDMHWIRFALEYDLIDSLQFEYGSTATEYENYIKSNDITIQFGQTVYSAKYYPDNGELILLKKIQNLGELNWTYDSRYIRFVSQAIDDIKYYNIRRNPLLCSCYQVISDGRTIPNLPDYVIYGGGEEKSVYIHDSKYGTDASALKTAISGQTICYELAEPIIITLFPQQISLLKGANNIYTTGNKITLSYVNGTFATIDPATESTDGLMSALDKIKMDSLGSAAFKDTTDEYSSTGTDPVTGKAIAAAINELPEPMVFRGTLGSGGTITSLPVDGSAKIGDTYKVITAGTYDSKAADVGDTFICNGKTTSTNTWELIPSGDEPSGTVTNIATGAGLTGGPITSSGTIKANLKSETASTLASNNISSTAGRQYAVNLDSDDKLSVNVPWEDTNNKVTQTASPDNADYRILLSNGANNDIETAGVKKNSHLTFNPGTSTLTADTVKLNKSINRYLTGTGTAGSNTGSTYYPSKWVFNIGLAPSDGDEVTIMVPVAGYSKGIWMTTDNETTYHPVAAQSGSRLSNVFPVNAIITVVYCSNISCSIYALNGSTSGTTVTGVWLVKNYYNTNDNTYDRNKYVGTVKAWSTALVSGNIIVAGTDGTYRHLKEGTPFDIKCPILYLAEAVAANGTTTNTYDIIPFTVTTTQSIILTSYLPVYIRGTLDGTIFTPDGSTPLTQTVPSNEDGYFYILLGRAYSTTAIYLQEIHPIYRYHDKSFKEYAGSASTAGKAFSDWRGNVIDTTYVKKSGDTMTGQLFLKGSAASKPLKTRGIIGVTTAGDAEDALYIQFGNTTNDTINLGATSGASITNNGTQYSGNAATATNASKVNNHTVETDVPSGAVFTDTIPSGYCTTGASTAAKSVLCHNYQLLDKSYLQVILANANTYAGAITLNVNSKGAKTVYINGTASSSSNYTLPAGSYIVYYQDNIYYFRTDGGLTGRGIFKTDSTGDNIGHYYAFNKYIANETDLNSLKAPGFYNATSQNNCTHMPNISSYDTDAFALQVMHSASGEYYIQIFYLNRYNKIFKRYCTAGDTWTAWTEITDYTPTEKTKLSGISTGANKVESSTTNGNIKIDGAETKVYDDSEIKQELDSETIEITGKNPIVFDAPAVQKSKDTVIHIKPFQDMNGYGNAYPGGGGKNLLNISIIRRRSANTRLEVIQEQKWTAGDTYVFSTNISDLQFALSVVDDNGTQLEDSGWLNPGTSYTIKNTGKLGPSGYGVRYSDNRSITDAEIETIRVSRSQLEKASTSTLWAPYENTCPLIPRSEINIEHTGENLFNPYVQEKLYIQDIGGYRYGHIFRPDSYTIINDDPIYSLYYRIINADKTSWTAGTSINANSSTNVIVASDKLLFVYTGIDAKELSESRRKRVYVGLTSYTDGFKEYNIYKKLKVLLGDDYYGGTLNLETGEFTVEYGYYTLTGNESMGKGTADQGVYIQNDNVAKLMDYTGEIRSDKLPTYGDNVHLNPVDFGCSGYADVKDLYPGQNWIYIKNINCQDEDSATTKANYKTWLQSANISIMYPLANPYTIQLSAEQLDYVKGTNSVFTDNFDDTIDTTYRGGIYATSEELKDVTDALNRTASIREGNPVYIESNVDQNAKSSNFTIEPVQDLHGYPEPWAGGNGKNVLPVTLARLKTINNEGTWTGNNYELHGMTFTPICDPDDNVLWINVNGTNDGNNTYFYLIKYPTDSSSILAPGTYYMSGCPSGGSNNTYTFKFQEVGSAGTAESSYDDNGSGVSFTYRSGYSPNCLIIIRSTTSLFNVQYKPMLCLNSLADKSYEPYTNICSISGRTELPVYNYNNMIDMSEFDIDVLLERGSIASNEGTNVDGTYLSNRLRLPDFISAYQGYQITVTLPDTTIYRWGLFSYKTDGTYLGWSGWITTKTSYIAVGCGKFRAVFSYQDNRDITDAGIALFKSFIKITRKPVLEGYFGFNNGTRSYASNWLTTALLPCKPNTSYTVSSKKFFTNRYGVNFFDENETFISTITPNSSYTSTPAIPLSQTFTTPANAAYFDFTWHTPINAPDQIDDLFIGTVRNTLTVKLGTTVYGAELDLENGRLVLDHKALTLPTDTSKWTKSTSVGIKTGRAGYWCNNTVFADCVYSGGDDNPNGVIMSYNCYPTGSTACLDVIPLETFAIGIGISSNKTNVWINVDSTLCPDISSFCTWLTSNPIQAYYPLATPIVYEISKENLKLFKGANTITIDYGQMAIEYTDGSVAYLEDIQDFIKSRDTFSATCTTAGGTAAKVITLVDDKGWELRPGTVIGVKFTNSNTASGVTLNVNGSGAKNIWYKDYDYSAGTGVSTNVCGTAGYTIYYMYNGTYWVWLNVGGVVNTDGNVRQIPTSDNKYYRLIFSGNNNNSDETTYVRKTANLLYNPSLEILWNSYYGSPQGIGARLTSINLTPMTPGQAGRTVVRFDLVSSSVTTGAPPAAPDQTSAGYLHTYYWDNSANSMTQLYIPNGNRVTSGTAADQGLMMRGYTANGAWTNWTIIPFLRGTITTGQVLVSDGVTGAIKTSGYTIATSVPSGAVFTDQKVTQSETTTVNWRKVILGAQNDASRGTAVTSQTNQVYVTPKIEVQPSTGALRASIFTIGVGDGTSGGIALYNSNDNPDNFGIAFRKTSNKEKHGYVQGDWATYFTMNDQDDRGWVFRRNKTDGNVASIDSKGRAVFNGSVTVGGNTANTSGAKMEYNSTNKCIDFTFN